MPGPDFSIDKCDGCGLCLSVCINNGLKLTDGRIEFIGGDLCIWCSICEAVCERGVIRCPYEIIVDDPNAGSELQDPKQCAYKPNKDAKKFQEAQ